MLKYASHLSRNEAARGSGAVQGGRADTGGTMHKCLKYSYSLLDKVRDITLKVVCM